MTKRELDDPLVDLILDDEENELETALQKGEFQENADFEETKRMLEDAARQYRQLHTSKSITLRINQLDLVKIKAKAKRNNLPYQTLLGVALHDFAENKQHLTIK